jgi:uncharacterized protein with FMN-binding domain
MRRAVLTLSGTVAGLAALFSFRTHVPGISEVATPSTPVGLSGSAPAVSASATASPTLKPPTSTPSKSSTAKSPTAKASTAPTMTQTTTAPATTPATTTPSSAKASSAPTKKASSPATTAPAAAPSTTAPPSGSYAGPTENTQYGEVQVTITVSGGKITNAVGSLPGGGDSIGANAVSQLDSEVVADQSANVQAVSGATYTSDGYIASLQSAVDKAGL